MRIRVLTCIFFLIFFWGSGIAAASGYQNGDAGPWTIGVKDGSYEDLGGWNTSYYQPFTIGDPDDGFGGTVALESRYAQVAFQLEQTGWYYLYHDGWYPANGVIQFFRIDPALPWTEDPPTDNHELLAERYGLPEDGKWRILKIPMYLATGGNVLRICGLSGDGVAFNQDFVALHEMPHVPPPWQIGVFNDTTLEYYFQQNAPLPPEATPEEKDALATSYQTRMSEFVVGQDWVTEFGGWRQYDIADIHFLLSAREARMDHILTLDANYAGDADAPHTIDVNVNGVFLGQAAFDTSWNPAPRQMVLPAGALACSSNTLRLEVFDAAGWPTHFMWDAIRLDPDCNGNGIPDEEDIASGEALDFDENGVPDSCQCPANVAEAAEWISADTDDRIDGDGCPPDDAYRNHGQYMKCVVPFVKAALVEYEQCFDGDELDEIQSMVISEKAKSDVGK